MRVIAVIIALLSASLPTVSIAQTNTVAECEPKITFADNTQDKEIEIEYYQIVCSDEVAVNKLAVQLQNYPRTFTASETYINRLASSICTIDNYRLKSILVRRDMKTEDMYELLLVYD